MNNWITRILLTIVIILGVYYVNNYINRTTFPNLEYNTVYSEGYNHANFTKIEIGMKKTDVEALLNKPLSILTPKFIHSILYTNQSAKLGSHGEVLVSTNTSENMKFLRLKFDKEGRILSTFNSNKYIDKIRLEKIEQMNYQSILGELGNPTDEIKCDCNCSVNFYSKLKDGKYTGKTPQIMNKRIAFDETGKVKIVIDQIGNPYNDQLGICQTN